MILDKGIKLKLAQDLKCLKTAIIIKVSVDDDDGKSKEMRAFLNEFVEISPKIAIEEVRLSRTPSFAIAKRGEVARIEFAGIPLAQELDSFILAMLQIAGQETQIDEVLVRRIRNIDKKIHFETYVSLSCHNCSKVVQSLNLMASMNGNISHTMIESRTFHAECQRKSILSVPTIIIDGEEVASGRQTLEQLIELATGIKEKMGLSNKPIFDVLIVGGGPAGNSAAIYTARKGLYTGMIVEAYGGKMLEISGIENMIGIPYVKGLDLKGSIEQHLNQYDVDIMKNQHVVSLRKQKLIEVELENGGILKAKTVIISTGANWKELKIQGETALYSKGVTNCPHCDGPLFSGKTVAVVGSGNPAILGAIDLARITQHVYVFEESTTLKADKILLRRLNSFENVTVVKNAKLLEILGTDYVTGVVYIEGENQKERQMTLDGIFIQLGLVPTTDWLKSSEVELNGKGEIIIDNQGRTNVPGVFAAGDCTDSVFKQIIIAMGAGATAALGACGYIAKEG